MSNAKRLPPQRLMSQAEMVHELDEIVTKIFAEEGKAEYPLIQARFFEAHPCVDGEDDAHILCTYEHLSDTLRAVISKRNPARAGEKISAQLSLPSFDKVQDVYSVEGDGITVAVRIIDMTREEAIARAKVLRTMSKTCLEHARQLERFAEKFLA